MNVVDAPQIGLIVVCGRSATMDEFRKLREELKPNVDKAVPVVVGAKQAAEQEAAAQRDLLTDLQLKRQQYKRRKEQHGDREAAVCIRTRLCMVLLVWAAWCMMGLCCSFFHCRSFAGLLVVLPRFSSDGLLGQ